MAQVHQKFIRSINDLQRSVERYEVLNDGHVLPDLRVIIRLDAHRHGDWSRIPEGEYPCGSKISQALIGTAQDVMQSGIHCVLSMIHGDEILVYVDPRELSSPRRRARLISFFASSAAANFLLRFGLPVLFHARVAELPSNDRVVEYLMWQRRCALRNAIVHELRRVLLAQGVAPEDIEAQLARVTEEERIRRLEEAGSPLSAMTAHKRFGSMVWWQRSAPAPGAVSTNLHSQIGLPEDDTQFIDFVLERLKLSTSIQASIPQLDSPADSLTSTSQDVAPPPQKESVRFTHEKGSKRNTLIMRVSSDYKR